MKKSTALVLICSLLTLTGCSSDAGTVSVQAVGNFQPDATANPIAEGAVSSPEPLVTVQATDAPLATVVDEPLDPPDDALAESVVDVTNAPEDAQEPSEEGDAESKDPVEAGDAQEPSEAEPEPTAQSVYADYSYAALTDSAFGFLMEYPADWRNLPGKYTACFQQQTSESEYAARVAVSAKELAHKPDDAALVKQFKLFAKQIYDQYDAETFEFGELQECTFMGKSGYEIIYLAYDGDVEIKGYLSCCSDGYTVYVYHFYSAYEDYDDMSPLREHVRDSVTLAQ